MDTNVKARAGFFRRLAAMVYDALVAIAVGMCAALLIILVLTILFENNLLSKQGYEHVSDVIQGSLLYKIIIQIWVGFWVIAFFLWFWKHGGQTLGMRAWRLRIFALKENQEMSYLHLLGRMLASLGGLGTLLVLFDLKNKQSLQDRLANTEVLVLTKLENDHTNW
ncbi:RDD family protein [Glaciecola sp. 1036]|uniref:RDD family protein n=1 Tax=Alteromonadaceae TaxID=72275 RepID=UPI003D03F4E6